MCYTPIYVKTLSGDKVPVPCGKCPVCAARRTSIWSFRLMQEYNVSVSAHFLTLTYDTDNVPITKSGRMTLQKDHVQHFMMRLRKAHGKLHEPLKYFCAGEYGDKSWRPHYHMILFNAREELIQPAWWYGSIHYGGVTGASVGYTLKYISKGKRVPQYNGDDRLREFCLISKKLGISYLSDKMVKWHLDDVGARMYCNLEDGRKIAMARYYKDKIYDDIQRDVASKAGVLRVMEKVAYDIDKCVSRETYDDQYKERVRASFLLMANRAKDTGKI